VDGHAIVCKISSDALEDVDPSNASGTVESQFLANRWRFEAIARKKILAGAVADISIGSADVLA
jgi:hypothetical protein